MHENQLIVEAFWNYIFNLNQGTFFNSKSYMTSFLMPMKSNQIAIFLCMSCTISLLQSIIIIYGAFTPKNRNKHMGQL